MNRNFLENLLLMTLTDAIMDNADKDDESVLSIACMSGYTKFDNRFLRIVRRYTKPDKTSIEADSIRDKDLKEQRKALLELIQSFEKQLTDFEQAYPLPKEYDDNFFQKRSNDYV